MIDKTAQEEIDAVTEALNSPIIPSELISYIKAYAAGVNNYLMTISVSGDNILHSAKFMEESHEIVKKLEELK